MSAWNRHFQASYIALHLSPPSPVLLLPPKPVHSNGQRCMRLPRNRTDDIAPVANLLFKYSQPIQLLRSIWIVFSSSTQKSPATCRLSHSGRLPGSNIFESGIIIIRRRLLQQVYGIAGLKRWNSPFLFHL